MLDVNGNARINGVVHPVSDRRLKEDVEAVTHGLAAVKQMRGVSYVWKDKSNGRDRRELGLIAQEVEKITPELVDTDDSERHLKALNYDGFSALFVEAIKELDGRIEEVSRTRLARSSSAELPDWLLALLAMQSIAIVWLLVRRR